MEQMYGYVGKIARIDLSLRTFTTIPTTNYVPKYMGGRGIANKIFWDEVGPGVQAFDAENKIIYMTGPATGTGIPTGGRSVFTSVAANNYPEQYAWSGIGGMIGAELKFAGFDGLIIEGKSESPVYLYIEDGNIQFLSAQPLWGHLVHDTQRLLEEIHGEKVKSMVIGPAGENLVRIASVTTSNDNVAAKAGLGAVFGSKKLKAISIVGTGTVVPANIEKVLELRKKMADPAMIKRPVINETAFGVPGATSPVEGGWKRAQVACSHGCNMHCECLMLDMKAAGSDVKVNHVEKCVSIFAFGLSRDVPYAGPGDIFQSRKNHHLACKMLARELDPPDESDPYAKEMFNFHLGDVLNFWQFNFDKGSVINDLCNEYGIDKWDVLIWLLPWLSMGKQEGVFDGIDFGMEIDLESEAFIRYLLDMIVYRKGYYGNLLAEGMARAIRTLGMEKFGKTIYHGRFSTMLDDKGKQLDLPISLEGAWGHTVHWQGRGFQGSIEKPAWVATNLHQMLSTRDTQTIQHHHDTIEHYMELKDDPCRSPLTVQAVIMGENKAEIKDSIPCCDWQSPNLYWTDMESQMFEAATGFPTTEEDLNIAAERSRLLFRSIIIRNYNRTREMEVKEIFPIMTYPDPWGKTVEWDEWNDLVDLYYTQRGWDLKTGWPTREALERVGLSDVADELAKIGKLP